MRISVVGTGYVGLVTGVCLAEVGHDIICIDIDKEKINKLKEGFSSIYEPELEELMEKNMQRKRLSFTTDHKWGFQNADIIIIAVGTPQNQDGSADLSYIEQTAKDVAQNITSDVIVVTKSTVPVGTNKYIKEIILQNLKKTVKVDVVSNPEFLREGSAVYDTFHGDRIVIGCENDTTSKIMEEIYKPIKTPIFKTDIRSAELIKYASNAFLAMKISFINEISNICEKFGANIIDVAYGIGKDKRIGSKFLNAGIGYGGSCFPKDNLALLNMAKDSDYDFQLLDSVIKVNQTQKKILIDKALRRFEDLKDKEVALLGLAFKPNTDDMREAASIVVSDGLLDLGAKVKVYDPIAMDNAKEMLNSRIIYVNSVEEALKGADCAFILTEWDEFKNLNLSQVPFLMNEPIIFDGRNCFKIDEIQKFDIEYHSIGRCSIYRNKLIS